MDNIHAPEEQAPQPDNAKATSVEHIQQLLKAKDDTSRFVGLALLKSTLDASEELRSDQSVVDALWCSISPKFLDRLIRTGSKPGSKQTDTREMLDLAVNVIYIFTALLPGDSKSKSKLVDRAPLLVDAVLQSSEETTDFILKTLLTIVSSSSEGSSAFGAVDDWSPLVEIAPKQPMVLSILAWSWINGINSDRTAAATRINDTIGALCASYKGTDGVTLLDFLSKLLSRLDSDLIPKNPPWLGTVVTFIHNLAASKPTAAGREAYTNSAANLLVTYGDTASDMVFQDIFKSSKSLPYLFMSLILIDIRSSLPNLLENLNRTDYPATSERITSGLIILSFFINRLLQMIERADSEDVFTDVQPDLLLKLRDSVIETLSLVMEYLRDRWDAAIAGAQGLHPEARSGVTHTASGSMKALPWDSKHESASEDRLLLAALKSLGDWLREDDAPTLRNEATNLIDLLMDLYESTSAARVGVATRPLVLGVLDGIIKENDGVQALLDHNGWTILSKDLLVILADSGETGQLEHELGQHISAILSAITSSRSVTPEDWLDLVTGVSAYTVPPVPLPLLSLQHLWADVLELSASLLTKAPPGVQRRYVHSASALTGIARVICEKELDGTAKAQIQDAERLLSEDPMLSNFR
ncbi:hypothetical protein SCUP234_10396 [Seiridium cupressi]